MERWQVLLRRSCEVSAAGSSHKYIWKRQYRTYGHRLPSALSVEEKAEAGERHLHFIERLFWMRRAPTYRMSINSEDIEPYPQLARTRPLREHRGTAGCRGAYDYAILLAAMS